MFMVLTCDRRAVKKEGVIAEGHPEDLAHAAKSYTRQFLKRML
jgi:hypothetical protein